MRWRLMAPGNRAVRTSNAGQLLFTGIVRPDVRPGWLRPT